METSIQKIRDLLQQEVNYSASEQQSRVYYNFLKDCRSLYKQLEYFEYTGVLTLSLFYGRKGNLIDDAISFIESEYKQYKEWVKYDYINRSTLFFEWANLLKAKGKKYEALEKVKKAILYNLTDNVSYDGYEFLSFRGCTKYVLSEIADETLSLMHPSEFNDPLDTVLLQWLDNQIKQGAENFELQKEALQNLRVRCFTRTANLPRNENSAEDALRLRKYKKQDVLKVNPLMWAHYAEDHKGICIKYHFKSEQIPLLNDKETELFRIGNVDYKARFSVNELEIKVWDALFAKSKVWKYEHETRLVYYSTDEVPRVKTFKIPGAITEIYLGLRCSEEDERIIKVSSKN